MTILNRQRAHPVDRESLAGFLRQVASRVGGGGADSMAICLVSDRKMREYNRRFRGKDAPTDVLSFPTDGEGPEGERHLGDIVISVTSAVRQAAKARHSLEREIRVLAVHGYLHLLGHDHEIDDGTMLSLQRRLMRDLDPGGRARS